jgi:hypothetical protein
MVELTRTAAQVAFCTPRASAGRRPRSRRAARRPGIVAVRWFAATDTASSGRDPDLAAPFRCLAAPPER